MNAKLTIENITPPKASELLQNAFESQRQLRESHVNRLAREITEGRWKLSPDAILLIKNKLANGQHRLSAVVVAGKPCPFIVMSSNDDELYKVLDCGIKRTVGDVLITAEHRNQVAAIASWVVRYDKKLISPTQLQMGKGDNMATRGDIVEFAQTHLGEIQDCIGFLLPLYRQKPLLAISITGAVMILALRKNKPELVQQFFSSFYLGTSRDDAAWDARERCIRNKTSKAKLPTPYIFGILLRAFISYRQGTRPGVLKIIDSIPEL